MKSLLKNLSLLLFLATLAFTSCDEPPPEPAPAPLRARAGADQTVQAGQTVSLDGTASTGQDLSFLWSITRRPAGSNAVLTGASTAKPSFVADVAGEYEVELTLSSQGASSQDKLLVTAAAGLGPLVLDDITVNTVLEDRLSDPDLPDYLVNKTIAVSARLTVKPGVIIAFAQDALLQVNEGGELIATGETSKKIRFTGKLAQKGYWAGILFYSRSTANELTHTEILNAGSTAMVSGVKAGVLVSEAARLTLKNTLISRSGGYGLYLDPGSILGGFSQNTFSHNAAAPLRLTANHVPGLDAASLFTAENGANAVEVMQSEISGTPEARWPAFSDNTPFRFTGQVTARTGWKLSPGITIEVAEDQYIEVAEGYLLAVGTPEKKITFTGAVKTTGSWNGIILYPRSASNRMEHVRVSYAGGDELLSGIRSSVILTHNASLLLTQSSISNSGGYGICIFDRNATLNADAATANTFSSNVLAPVFYKEN